MTQSPPWLRLQRAILANPKFMRLSLAQRGVLMTTLAATDGTGRLPPIDDMAFYLGLGEIECRAVLDELLARKWLVGEVIDGEARYRFKGWDKHQQPSDNAAVRMRELREKRRKPATCSERVQNSSEHVRSREDKRRVEEKGLTDLSPKDEDDALRSRAEGARTTPVEDQQEPPTPAAPAQVFRTVTRDDPDWAMWLGKAHDAFKPTIIRAGALRVDQDGFVFTAKKSSEVTPCPD